MLVFDSKRAKYEISKKKKSNRQKMSPSFCSTSMNPQRSQTQRPVLKNVCLC